MKGVDERCPSEASRHARSAGHANGASEAFVTRSKIALECRHRCFDALGSRSQLLTKCRQTIASKLSFDQAAAHTLLEVCNATLHRGLIDAESLCSRLHAARARERQEMPQIVPSKRPPGRSMQFCEPIPQSFDCPNVHAIGIVCNLGPDTTGDSQETADERRSRSGHGSHVWPLAQPDTVCRYRTGRIRSPRQTQGEDAGDACCGVGRRPKP